MGSRRRKKNLTANTDVEVEIKQNFKIGGFWGGVISIHTYNNSIIIPQGELLGRPVI